MDLWRAKVKDIQNEKERKAKAKDDVSKKSDEKEMFIKCKTKC